MISDIESDPKLKDTFRYLETHTFVRDVYQGKKYNSFSPKIFVQALNNHASSNQGNLNKFNEDKKLFFKSHKESFEDELGKLHSDLLTNNEQGVKNRLSNVLHKLSQNNVNQQVMMDTYAVLAGVLDMNVDCSELRKKDFYKKGEPKDYYKSIVEVSFKGLGNANSQLDMADAIKASEKIVKGRKMDETQSRELRDVLKSNKRL